MRYGNTAVPRWVNTRARCTLAVVAATALLLALFPSSRAAMTSGELRESLLVPYMRLMLAQQIPAQAREIVSGSAEDIASQVDAVTTAWFKKQVAAIRAGLERQFSANAKAAFEDFIAEFTTAENENDASYLKAITRDIGIPPPEPTEYSEFRLRVVEGFLGSDMEAGSELLSEIQTWADVKARNADAPDLNIWLARNDAIAPVAAGGASASSSVPEIDPLEAAEAEFGEVDFEFDDGGSPLDDFDASRKAKRDRKMKEAQAGMQQIAAERQAAEEEYAQRKLSAAQAEAEGMKHHAEELAAVEQQALEQRQRSWGNRLKSIVGTAAGSFGGAFLGGVGERAAQEAIDQVWQ